MIGSFWKKDETYICFVDSSFYEQILGKAESFFTKKELLEFKKIKLPIKRSDWATSRYAAKYVAYKLSGIGFRHWEIKSKIFSKPKIKGMNKLSLSLSHSSGSGAAVISRQSVGIDLEEIRTFSDAMKRKIFTRTDLDTAEKISVNQKISMTILWCIKESVIKIKSGKITDVIKVNVFTKNGKILASVGSDTYRIILVKKIRNKILVVVAANC